MRTTGVARPRVVCIEASNATDLASMDGMTSASWKAPLKDKRGRDEEVGWCEKSWTRHASERELHLATSNGRYYSFAADQSR